MCPPPSRPRNGPETAQAGHQNRFWNPKLLLPARSARMGVGKRILHPWRPKTASYGLNRRQKNPKHPKTLLNHSVRNGFWRLQVAARRSNTAPRPIRAAPTVGAPSGACGRTAYAVIPSPTWHLGPDCGAFWPRASILPLKSGAQSNQALVAAHRRRSTSGLEFDFMAIL
jgi:hypothetical protein